MSIRVAGFHDVPKIVDFAQEFHEKHSNLKDIPFVRKDMVDVVTGHIGYPKHIVYVYEVDGELEGFIMGSVEPFPFNTKMKWAGDTFFIAHKGGAYLLKKFLSWAKANKVKRVYMAVSTGYSVADKLYEACGLERTGGMYRVVY